jgi:Acetyltransferase (GNAT) domain
MLMILLPEDQHLPTPEGSSPYDPHLRFPAITSDAIAGTPIGNLGMKDDYEIGYMVAYEHWGKGYTAEALAGMLREIWNESEKGKFGTLPRDKPAAGKEGEPAEGEPAEGREYVAATTNPSNRQSMRVLEKNGFLLSGSKEVEDLAQTKEDKEKTGVKMFQLNYFKKYKPGRTWSVGARTRY